MIDAPTECFCASCRPTSLPHVCSACGEEIRFGGRGAVVGYLHREDVDHAAVLGHRVLASDYEEWERQLDLPRTRTNKAGEEVVYTTRNWRQTKKSQAEAGDADGKIEEAWDGIMPEPEVRADPSVMPYPLRAAVPNGAWLVLKPALAAGMEVVRATYARGPWLHAGGQRPKIQETWVVAVRVPGLDYGTRAAVGCWRNTEKGWQFEHGMLVTDRRGRFVSAAEIKTWIKTIKEAHRG